MHSGNTSYFLNNRYSKERDAENCRDPRVKDKAIKSRNAVLSLDTSRVLERSDLRTVALIEIILNLKAVKHLL